MSTNATLRMALYAVSTVLLASCAPSVEQSVGWSTASALSSDGVSIEYQVAGDGPVSLVFVHGWSCDRSYWDKQLDHFAASNKVVALDLAGHGSSGLNREEWTMSAFGEDVAAVVTSLDLENVVLVGHSMGSIVVVEAAKRIPDRVIGLVAVDEFVNLDEAMSSDEVDELLAPFEDDFAASASQFIPGFFFVQTSDSTLVETITDDMAAAPPDVAVPAARNSLLWYGRHAEEELSSIGAPIRAINSDFNPTNVEAADRYGIDVVLMSGVGHFVMMEDADTFNALLSEAIDDFESGR